MYSVPVCGIFISLSSFRLQQLRAEREDQMFPDEVDTPLNTPARTRFQKYVLLCSTTGIISVLLNLYQSPLLLDIVV